MEHWKGYMYFSHTCSRFSWFYFILKCVFLDTDKNYWLHIFLIKVTSFRIYTNQGRQCLIYKEQLSSNHRYYVQIHIFYFIWGKRSLLCGTLWRSFKRKRCWNTFYIWIYLNNIKKKKKEKKWLKYEEMMGNWWAQL